MFWPRNKSHRTYKRYKKYEGKKIKIDQKPNIKEKDMVPLAKNPLVPKPMKNAIPNT